MERNEVDLLLQLDVMRKRRNVILSQSSYNCIVHACLTRYQAKEVISVVEEWSTKSNPIGIPVKHSSYLSKLLTYHPPPNSATIKMIVTHFKMWPKYIYHNELDAVYDILKFNSFIIRILCKKGKSVSNEEVNDCRNGNDNSNNNNNIISNGYGVIHHEVSSSRHARYVYSSSRHRSDSVLDEDILLTFFQLIESRKAPHVGNKLLSWCIDNIYEK